MSTLCIDQQGSILSRKDQRFILRHKNRVIADIPAFRLEQIIVMGNSTITPDAMKLIFSSGVDTIFMSIKGKFYGRIYTPNLKQVDLRLLQYERSRDEDFKLNFAKETVAGKLSNYRNILIKLNKKSNKSISEKSFKIRIITEKSQTAQSIQSLLGYEGTGSALYFSALKELLKQDLGFTGRHKRPPRDPVNSLLSFGYTLLYREFCIIVNTVGLDPFIGFLHSPEDNRESLPLDLMEEFRPVIDNLVISLINRREMEKPDFETHDDGSVTISKKAIGRFMNEIYNQFRQEYPYCFTTPNSPSPDPPSDRNPFPQPNDHLFNSPPSTDTSPSFNIGSPPTGVSSAHGDSSLYGGFTLRQENHTLRNIMLHQTRLFVRHLKGEEKYKFYEL